jgi:hypothetical protein
MDLAGKWDPGEGRLGNLVTTRTSRTSGAKGNIRVCWNLEIMVRSAATKEGQKTGAINACFLTREGSSH